MLTCSQDTMVNEPDCVEFGLSRAGICKPLERWMDGTNLDDLSKSVCDTISNWRCKPHQRHVSVLPLTLLPITGPLQEIRKEAIKRSGRHGVSQFLHHDGDMIAAWKSDLNRLHVFNVHVPPRGRYIHTIIVTCAMTH